MLSRYPEIRLAGAQYSMAQLSGWYSEIKQSSVMDVDGIAGLDTDEGTNRIEIHVRDEIAQAQIEARLKEIDIPSGAVDIPVQKGTTKFLSHSVRKKFDPLDASGVKIHDDVGSNEPCTLGFITERNDQLGAVVASHCTETLFDDDSSSQDEQHQPVATDPIGEEDTDPDWNDDSEGSCPAGDDCRMSDSAFIDINIFSRQDFDRGLIARTTGSTSIFIEHDDPPGARFRIIDEGVAVEDETVHKVGQRTGWTTGSVNDTCVDRPVPGMSDTWFLCQDVVDYDADHGDSGSPTFRKVDTFQEGDVDLLGILWGVHFDENGLAIEAYVSPIGNVYDDLGDATAIWDTCESTFSC